MADLVGGHRLGAFIQMHNITNTIHPNTSDESESRVKTSGVELPS